MKYEDRIEWIDIARGISIVMVILLHSCTSVIRRNDFGAFLIYYFGLTFAVAVLFFLAGCSLSIGVDKYRSMKFVFFLKKKVVGLIVPYLFYTTFIYVIFEITNHIPGAKALMEGAGYGHMELRRFIIGLLIGNNSFSSHVWYLYVLFIYEIIAFVILKYVGKYYPLYILTVITLIFSILFDINISLAWNGLIDAFIFFTMGIVLVRKDFKKTTVILAVVLWLIIFALIVRWIMLTGTDGYLLTDLIPLMAIVVISYVSRRITGSVADVLKGWGQKSMALYLLQQPFFGSALGTILFAVLGLPAYLSVMICIVASFAMPLFIRRVFIRYGWFRFLFGIR